MESNKDVLNKPYGSLCQEMLLLYEISYVTTKIQKYGANQKSLEKKLLIRKQQRITSFFQKFVPATCSAKGRGYD